MSKSNVLILIFSFFVSSLVAQIEFGIQGTYGQSLAKEADSYVINPNQEITHRLAYMNSSSSRSIGVFALYKAAYLYLLPELKFTQYNNSYSLTTFISDAPIQNELQENYGFIDLSVMSGLRHKNFRVGVGPVIHYLASFDSDLDNTNVVSTDHRKISTGFQFGLGVDVNFISLDIKYENAFRTVGDHLQAGTQNLRIDENPDMISVALGIRI